MELRDIGTGIMLAQAGLATGIARAQARQAQGRANDSFIASSIHLSAAKAFADGNARLYQKLLASNLEVDRLESKVDDLQDTVGALTKQRAALIAQRAVILRECQILLAENAAVLARLH